MPACSIVIPVHNRCATTLACLQHLRAQGLLSRWSVIVVDDGSTDGTDPAVRTAFPEVVLLSGSGDLWWTGGIVRGMREAMQRGADFIFWLNDDTLPAPGALDALLTESILSGGLSGGVCLLPGETAPAYSGQHRGFWHLGPALDPGEATVPCDALNGNLVCVPAAVVRAIGYPDERGLPQVLADSDYTLRARRAGYPIQLVGRARAVAQANLTTNYRSWLLSDVSPLHWWRELSRRGSHLHFRSQVRFHVRHWHVAGLAWCVAQLLKLAAITVLRSLIPVTTLRRWRGARSAAWQHEQRHRSSTMDDPTKR
jgi:GT2 family glycosyltransferase